MINYSNSHQVKKLKYVLGILLVFIISNTIHANATFKNGSQPVMNHAKEQFTDSLKHKLEYSATDSIKYNRDQSIVSLYGHAILNCTNFNITADEIVFNKSTHKIKAKNYKITDKAGKNTSGGASGEFGVNENLR